MRSLCRCTISLSAVFLLLTSAVFADEQPNNTFGLTDNGDSTYDVTYVSDADMYGFQFNVIPSVVTGVSGGDAAANGFTVSSGGGNVVLGFSFTGSFIPAGSGTLTSISTSGTIAIYIYR